MKPDYEWAWANKGETLRRAGRYDGAITALDRAIELKPDDEWAWAIKGEALRQAERYDEAIAALDRAIELKPDDEWAWAHKGVALRQAGRYDEAITALDRALELKPDHEWTWESKGGALRQAGRWDDAVAAPSRTISLTESSWPCYLRGLCYMALGQAEQARSDFAIAIERARASLSSEPQEAREQFNLALYLLVTGRTESALQAYRMGLTMNPDHTDLRDALEDLADLKEQMGQTPGLEEAEKLLKAQAT